MVVFVIVVVVLVWNVVYHTTPANFLSKFGNRILHAVIPHSGKYVHLEVVLPPALDYKLANRILSLKKCGGERIRWPSGALHRHHLKFLQQKRRNMTGNFAYGRQVAKGHSKRQTCYYSTLAQASLGLRASKT